MPLAKLTSSGMPLVSAERSHAGNAIGWWCISIARNWTDESKSLPVNGVGQHSLKWRRGVAGQMQPPGKKPMSHLVCGRTDLFRTGSAGSMSRDPTAQGDVFGQ